MNVVFISNQPYPSGMAGSKRVRLFAEYLTRQDIPTNVFVYTKSNGDNKPFGKVNNVNYKFIKYSLKNIFTGNRSLIKDISELYNTNTNNYIIVYGGLNIESFNSITKLKKMGYKIIIDLVEDYSKIEEKISSKLALRFILNSYINDHRLDQINGFIVISSFLQKQLKDKDIDSKNIQLIPISAENINYSTKKITDKNRFRFLYSGTYGIKDGLEYLLDAYKNLHRKYSNIELYLTGKTGRLKKHYQYLQDIDPQQNIKFLGKIPDAEYYNTLNSANVLMMTRTDSEYSNSGFPFKLGEYLATGNPVIGTDVGDVTHYLEDKNNILLAKPSDSKSIYEAMEYAYLNYDTCKIIGENGRKAAVKYFNPESNGKLLVKFLKQLG